MNWFSRKQQPIEIPDENRPANWTAKPIPTTLSKTRPTTISRLFDEVAALPDEAPKLQHLRQNDHPSVRTVLRYFLDDSIRFQVEVWDYDINKYEEAPTLYQEANRLYLFCNDPLRDSPVADKPEKRQKLFSDFLSALAPGEIKLVVRLVQNELPEGLSGDLILKAYPDLIPPGLGTLQRQNSRRLAERECARLQNEKLRLQALNESEIAATQVLKNKAAALERMNELLAAAQRRLGELS